MPSMTLTCAICNQPMHNRKGSAPQGVAAHNACRKSAGGLGTHGASGYRRGCRCDVCREGQRDKTATFYKGKRASVAKPDCIACGEPLIGAPRNGIAPRHAKCKPGGSFYVQRQVRLAIYQRDDWTCQICHAAVEREAHYLSDWYPTLDHVIPQAALPQSDHSQENLRLVHRYCNLVRGNERFTDIEVAVFADVRR